jgi:hypothetical protein
LRRRQPAGRPATLPPVERSSTTTAPPATTSCEVATGADDVVISVGYDGGFVPPGMIFARSPVALVAGDGRLLMTGPVAAIYPGPLLPNILERSITHAAVQRLLAQADRLGLLADVTYRRDDRVADAPDTIVDITVGGRTYHHQAYALGIDGGEADTARQRLAEFVEIMSDVAPTVGADALGPERPYAPAQFLIQAMPVDLTSLDIDIEPTVVPWPQDAPVRLTDAAVCAVLPAAVAAVQRVPGRTC